MRKGRRFTPARLAKWRDQGRGTGTGASYRPWHQVTRDDPGSRGRSHILNWTFGRLHHLLSDQELIAFAFATMVPNLVDLREQYPLAPDEHDLDTAAYRFGAGRRHLPGTVDLAHDLGFRHPVIRKESFTLDWIMTTDLVLTLESQDHGIALLAVSVKHHNELSNTRTRQLLAIERAYWQQQGVDWLLLTPETYDASTGLAVRTAMHWAMGHATADPGLLRTCADVGTSFSGVSMASALAVLSSHLTVDTFTAQRVFWQSVWAGLLPLRLSWALRPACPIALLPTGEFWSQNPIAMRRSAWKD